MNLIRRDKQKERTHLLILGLPRSGTSLLASLLGAHSQISMVCEDFGRSWMDALGKPVVGNKLCVPRQIDMERRRTALIKLLNRFGLRKRWPKSDYAIQDYLDIPNLKLILITRDPADVRASMENRGQLTWMGIDGQVQGKELSPELIDFTIERGTEILNELKEREHTFLVPFKELVNDTEATLQKLMPIIGVSYEGQMIETGPRWNWMYPKVSEKGIDKNKA